MDPEFVILWAPLQVAERVTQHIPNGVAQKLDGFTKHK